MNEAVSNELNAYQAPEAELLDTTQASQEKAFFTVSKTKLIVMFVMTLGLYQLVWHYQHWKRQKNHVSHKVRPVWRAIFSIFFTHSLFRNMHEATTKQTMPDWPHAMLATVAVFCNVVANLSDRLLERLPGYETWSIAMMIIAFIPLWPLVTAQTRCNELNNDPEGLENARFTGWNILFIVLGALLWALAILGTLLNLGIISLN